MDILTMIFIAAGLSMDSFAVSVVNGFSIKNIRMKNMLLIAASFTVFQTIMPVLGWFAGGTIEGYIRNTDHWIAFILLFYLGSRMIYNSSKESGSVIRKEIRVPEIITQSFATSIDALAVGLSLAVLNVQIVLPVLIIGLTTFFFSIAGLNIGKYSGKKFKRGSEIIGGIILILIGVKILIEHLSLHH
ncbi:MAG: manganese efflux pump MntP family protein [Acidobacteriota bacterium]